MNATERFARHALETRFEDLPANAVAAAKMFFLDTIGVGVAGARAVHADEILRTARAWGAPAVSGGAHVFGRRERLPAPTAAFVNGFQIHCQEFDCVHEPAVVHPMATIFAALMAECESNRGVSGDALIVATVVAVDVAAGIGVASKAPIKFFRPANAGLFGATLGVARLRGFSLQQALDALGFALAHCSGTMQAHVEGKPALPVQIGAAARAALVACDISGGGTPGPNDVFEGPFGYFPLFEGDYDLDPVLASLGDVWRIAEVSHKPFPTGRAAQGGIVAALELRGRGVNAGNLEALTLTAPPLIRRLVGRPYVDGMSVNYARLCFAYSGAIALYKGEVGLDDFAPVMLADGAIAALAKKITIVENGSSDPAAFTPQLASARLSSGETLEARVEDLLGSPANPLDREGRLDKFRRCIEFGFASAPASLADRLIAMVEDIESLRDASALARLAAGLDGGER